MSLRRRIFGKLLIDKAKLSSELLDGCLIGRPSVNLEGRGSRAWRQVSGLVAGLRWGREYRRCRGHAVEQVRTSCARVGINTTCQGGEDGVQGGCRSRRLTLEKASACARDYTVRHRVE